MVKCHLDLAFLDDSLKGVDLRLVEFYWGVIREDLPTAHKNTLRKLRQKYVRMLRGGDTAPVDFESSAVRSAYVFYYCPCFTSALISGLAEFVRGAPDFLDKVLSGSSLSVCCLGGGPGTEVVALFTLLREILSNHPGRDRLTIDAVVVDAESGWRETADRVVRRLGEEEGGPLRLNFRFLEHDLLSGPMTDDLKEVLARSDLVTMVKFLSTVHGRSDATIRSKFIEEISGSMAEEATLLLLESSGWKFLEEVIDAIGDKMSPVYGPSKHKHWMSRASRKACLRLYSREYGIQYCALRSINKVAVWRKKKTDL